jgi:hypothetical protein
MLMQSLHSQSPKHQNHHCNGTKALYLLIYPSSQQKQQHHAGSQEVRQQSKNGKETGLAINRHQNLMTRSKLVFSEHNYIGITQRYYEDIGLTIQSPHRL